MAYSDQYGNFFGRKINKAEVGGAVSILHEECGTVATRLDASVYPVGSDLGARHEHDDGIILSRHDADLLGIEIEEC